MGICVPCKKRIYKNRKLAKLVARRMTEGHVVAYRCPADSRYWHLGHLATPIIRGLASKADIYKEAA